MKQYYTRSWGFEIKEVDILRKSESSVWIMHNGRERRESNTYYFDTFDEAKQSLIDREKNRVAKLKRELNTAELDLRDAENLTP